MKKTLTKILPLALLTLLLLDLNPAALVPNKSVTHAGYDAELEAIENTQTPEAAAIVIEEAHAVVEAAEVVTEVVAEAVATQIVQEIKPIAVIEIVGEAVVGQKLTLAARVSGVPEGVQYKLQWQVTTTGMEEDYTDITGETGAQYSFMLTKANASYSWRVIVTVI